MRFAAVLTVCILLSSAAHAGEVLVTGSGTWGPNTITTPVSAPGDTWSISFDVSSPVPTDAVTSASFSNASYLLNGVAPSETISGVVFYPTAQSGLFDLQFSGGDVVEFYGAQVYDAAGNLLLGTYPSANDVNTSTGVLGTGTGSGTVNLSAAVPEPSSLILALAAVSGLGLVRLRRRVAA
jgi:hypothetical protein